MEMRFQLLRQRSEYVRRILEAYRTTPGTCGAVRRADRLLAAQLHERGESNSSFVRPARLRRG